MHAVKIGSNCRLKKIVVLANPFLKFAPCKKYGFVSFFIF